MKSILPASTSANNFRLVILILSYALSMLLFIHLVYAGRKELWQEMRWIYNNEHFFGKDVNYNITKSGLKYAILDIKPSTTIDDIDFANNINNIIETGDTIVIYYKLYLHHTNDDKKVHIYSQANENFKFTFEVGIHGVIITKGVDEAIRLMKLGDKGRFIVPPHISYGSKGENALKIPPDSHLEYYIEIVEIIKRMPSTYYRPSTEHLYRKQSL